MSSYAVIDETFDLNSSSTYHLSIQIGSGGFSLCILDTVRNKYIVLKHIHFDPPILKEQLLNKLKAFLYSDRFLKKQYKKVSLSIINQNSILVPGAVYKKDNIASYFRFTRLLSEKEELVANKLINTDAYNVFALEKGMTELLNNFFPVLHIYHHSTPYTENVLRSNRTRIQEIRVYCNVHLSFIDIVVSQADRLLLSNTFSYKNSSDLIYFILYVYKQLELSTENVALVLSGEVSVDSGLVDQIRNYIKRLILEKFSERYFYSYTFNKLPDHYFTNLINLYNCGS